MRHAILIVLFTRTATRQKETRHLPQPQPPPREGSWSGSSQRLATSGGCFAGIRYIIFLSNSRKESFQVFVMFRLTLKHVFCMFHDTVFPPMRRRRVTETLHPSAPVKFSALPRRIKKKKKKDTISWAATRGESRTTRVPLCQEAAFARARARPLRSRVKTPRDMARDVSFSKGG